MGYMKEKSEQENIKVSIMLASNKCRYMCMGLKLKCHIGCGGFPSAISGFFYRILLLTVYLQPENVNLLHHTK